jgi:NAD(P) transhydrogenase subunit alpha
MILGVVKESFPGERRVALTPNVLPSLAKAGVSLVVEAGAGGPAGYRDAEYEEKGARIVPQRAQVFETAEILAQVRGLGANPKHGRDDLPRLRRGQVLIATFEPLTALDEVRAVAERGVTLFALELVPRITRAQSMDVLSSMATIAGYKAVLLAAGELPRMFPMMMTAAGTITPARVLVIGAGVAGLQAIAFSRRLGAQVEAYDVRPAVKEEVQSLGAKFVEIEIETQAAQDAGGYARDLGEAFYAKQRELLTRVVAHSDCVITTAAVPGKTAPVLVTEEMVRGMAPGSVIVDLAAERGGNCALTRPGETVETHGVTILGPVNLASTVPFHASQMFAKNVATFLQNMIDKEKKLDLGKDDPIVKESMVVRDGEIVHAKIRESIGIGAAAGRSGS